MESTHSEAGAARCERLGELTYPEVEAIVGGPRATAAIIPIGSTEAHGPHLPLATDVIISEAMAERAAQRL